MRRQLRVSLVALLAVLAACVAINTQTAGASVPEDPHHPTIRGGFTGPGNYIVNGYPNGDIEIVRAGGSAPASTQDYPKVGPYMDARWRDTANGHPQLCVEAWAPEQAFHPIETVTVYWSDPDFRLYWGASGAVHPTDDDRYDYCDDNRWPGPYRIDVKQGMKFDTCYHFFTSINDDMLVDRWIVYMDDYAFGGSGQTPAGLCWGEAEKNVRYTSRAMGRAIGLLTHDGDGSPSVMANPAYIWPSEYDHRTLQWFNGPSHWLAALVLCVVAWFAGRAARVNLGRAERYAPGRYARRRRE